MYPPFPQPPRRGLSTGAVLALTAGGLAAAGMAAFVALIAVVLLLAPTPQAQAVEVPEGARLVETDDVDLEQSAPPVAWQVAVERDVTQASRVVSVGGTSYTVRSGDTLAKIARAHGTTWRALAARNNLADPDRIYVGDVLDVGKGGTSAEDDAFYEDEAGWDCRTMGNRSCGAYVEGVGWYVITFDANSKPVSVRER